MTIETDVQNLTTQVGVLVEEVSGLSTQAINLLGAVTVQKDILTSAATVTGAHVDAAAASAVAAQTAAADAVTTVDAAAQAIADAQTAAAAAQDAVANLDAIRSDAQLAATNAATSETNAANTLLTVEAARDEAATAMDTAVASATTATQAVADAQAHANAAQNSADSISGAVTDANVAKLAAETAEANATLWATKLTTEVIEGQGYSARQYAMNAAQSAADAAQAAGGTQVQADWTTIDTQSPAFIRNKPALAAVATSGLKADVGLGNVDNLSASSIRSGISATNIQTALAGVLTLSKSDQPAVVLRDSDAGTDLGYWAMWAASGGVTMNIGKQTDAGTKTAALTIDRTGNVTTAVSHTALGGFIATTPYAMRMKTSTGSTGIGALWKYDGINLALLFTGNGDANGNENTLRPFTVNAATGDVTLGHNATVTGNLTVANLVVNGTTTTVNSTTVTLDDPILTLGGDTAPVTNDAKDRGIEFQYHNGTSAKRGFFGYDASTGKMTFISDATNTGEVFSGAVGEIDAKVSFSNILNTPTTLAGYGITDGGTQGLTGAISSVLTENLMASRVVTTTTGGKLTAASVISVTELGHLDGLSSNLQDQLDGKQPLLSYAPVQQGTGVNQLANVVKIGMLADNTLGLTVDAVDFVSDWPINITGKSTGMTGVLPVANGGTGQTTIAGIKSALTLNNVTNTSDANKPVSTAQAAAIALKLDKAGGTMSGVLDMADNIIQQLLLLDVALVFLDKGAATTAQTLQYNLGNHQRLQIGAAFALTTDGWPAAGRNGIMLFELVNGAAFPFTWFTVNWIKNDGTFTTNINDSGVTLQSAGTDFILLWSRDGGVTIYGKVVR